MALDRRARRRQQTIDEILEVAVQVMAEEGVAGLSLSEVARRMGIQPPSLYKYFPSKLALYDALFQRGARESLAVYRAAAAQAEPGWAALVAGTEAVMRLGLDHQVVAQLLNWRPVPGFEPSPEAFAPSIEFVQEARRLLQVAVDRGELEQPARLLRGSGAAVDPGRRGDVPAARQPTPGFLGPRALHPPDAPGARAVPMRLPT